MVDSIQGLVASIAPAKFRFLAAERYRAYSAILWNLLQHRRAHEIEIYYDDLMVEALRVVPEVEPGPYSPDAFRTDVRQLAEWGNVAPPRLEPKRIETLADRTLQKFLYRLDDDTVAILEFLESRSRAAATLTDRGRHLLRDAADRLSEALRLARRLARHQPPAHHSAEDLLHLWYLCQEVDRKVDEGARELAAFDAALVGFAVSPFRLESLVEIVDRLDRYVEEYVAEATARARALHRAARTLLRPQLSEMLALALEQVERRLREDPLLAGAHAAAARDLRELLGDLARFFAQGGRFELLLERVHASARDVVRRVHRHVENIRARNIRIETLRDRSREMARLGEDHLNEANAWINGLFASAHVVTDLRCGTPAERAAPPRPSRRYETRRAPHHGGYLTEKRGTPGQARALERLRLLELGRFVERNILKGCTRALLRDAALESFADLRSLIDAVKAHELRAGRARRQLSFHIDKLSRLPERARFALADGTLDAPDLAFTAVPAGGHRD